MALIIIIIIVIINNNNNNNNNIVINYYYYYYYYYYFWFSFKRNWFTPGPPGNYQLPYFYYYYYYYYHYYYYFYYYYYFSAKCIQIWFNSLHKLHLRITRLKTISKELKYILQFKIYMTIWPKLKITKINLKNRETPCSSISSGKALLPSWMCREKYLQLYFAPLRNKNSTQLHNSSEGQNNYPQCPQRAAVLCWVPFWV